MATQELIERLRVSAALSTEQAIINSVPPFPTGSLLAIEESLATVAAILTNLDERLILRSTVIGAAQSILARDNSRMIWSGPWWSGPIAPILLSRIPKLTDADILSLTESSPDEKAGDYDILKERGAPRYLPLFTAGLSIGAVLGKLWKKYARSSEVDIPEGDEMRVAFDFLVSYINASTIDAIQMAVHTRPDYKHASERLSPSIDRQIANNDVREKLDVLIKDISDSERILPVVVGAVIFVAGVLVGFMAER